MGRGFGGREGDCPVSEAVSDRILRLPLFYELGDDEQGEVIAAVTGFRSGRTSRATAPGRPSERAN
jgi:dTDP-4-amino-4,6-dideoxygalactose transaminase